MAVFRAKRILDIQYFFCRFSHISPGYKNKSSNNLKELGVLWKSMSGQSASHCFISHILYIYDRCSTNLDQAFTNCVHGYHRTRNVHANGVSRRWKFVRAIDSSVCQCLFVLPCAWLPSSLAHRVKNQTFHPAVNQKSPSQSKGWFPFILICRREKCHCTVPLVYQINYTNMSWEQFMHLLKNYLNVTNIG